jgi:hypothetical protein
MAIKKTSKDYDKICMCWSFYQYMIDNMVEDNTIEGFLIAYNLTSDEALNICRENGYEIYEKHLVSVYNQLSNSYFLVDDFKAHSALFSSGQLDELRNLVNFKKWRENSKFTIQQAIYESIENLFKKRIPCNEFPNDFETYAPAFSMSQWEKLDKDFVPKVRFIQKGRYGLKNAIYEAIRMYLNNNPIKL